MATKNNKNKIILDLCGGTGSWSRPYREAGYKVVLITLPECDITKTIIDYRGCFRFRSPAGQVVHVVPIDQVHGILAAPPCTMFSFARTNAKRPRDLREGMETVKACLNIIWACQEQEQATESKKTALAWWALENPYHGFLKTFISQPAFTFDPWEFGDGYQKRTALWGHFATPKKKPVPMTAEAKAKAKTNSTLHTLGVKFDYLKSKDIHPEFFGKFDRQTRRSITPPGFANAFFKANP